MANDLKHAAPAPGGQPSDAPAPTADAPASADVAPVETGALHPEPMHDAVSSDATLEADRPEAKAHPPADADTPPLPEDLGDEPVSEANREARRNAQIRLRAGSDRARA